MGASSGVISLVPGGGVDFDIRLSFFPKNKCPAKEDPAGQSVSVS